MSATRLLVLGVVRMCGTAHGYQVRRELGTWSAPQWANVQPGSIYHALKKMAAEGLLDVAEQTQESTAGDRVSGDRTEYTLTAAGEVEYQTLMTHALSGSPSEQDNAALLAALAMIITLPRQRAIDLLNQRLNRLRAELLNVRETVRHYQDGARPQHIAAMYRFWSGELAAAVSWAEDMVARLEAGEYAMADDSTAGNAAIAE